MTGPILFVVLLVALFVYARALPPIPRHPIGLFQILSRRIDPSYFRTMGTAIRTDFSPWQKYTVMIEQRVLAEQRAKDAVKGLGSTSGY